MTKDIQQCLENLQPFSRGNFYAIQGQLNGDLGQLPAEWAYRYRVDTRLFRVIYTVMSYQTPIAWVLGDVDGAPLEAAIPDVYYSHTTSSRHQPPCKKYLPPIGKRVTAL